MPTFSNHLVLHLELRLAPGEIRLFASGIISGQEPLRGTAYTNQTSLTRSGLI